MELPLGQLLPKDKLRRECFPKEGLARGATLGCFPGERTTRERFPGIALGALPWKSPSHGCCLKGLPPPEYRGITFPSMRPLPQGISPLRMLETFTPGAIPLSGGGALGAMRRGLRSPNAHDASKENSRGGTLSWELLLPACFRCEERGPPEEECPRLVCSPSELLRPNRIMPRV